jgi:hypothetical protein
MCDILQIVYYLPYRIIIMAEEYSCPYCESRFESKEDMSKHIDRIHGDSGILEGAK